MVTVYPETQYFVTKDSGQISSSAYEKCVLIRFVQRHGDAFIVTSWKTPIFSPSFWVWLWANANEPWE